MPPRPRNSQMLKMPCNPSLGSQMLWLIPYGLRGNEPGGYALPRSSRQTRMPASASRKAVTEPPNPEPTTTASKCSSLTPAPRTASPGIEVGRDDVARDTVLAVRDCTHDVALVLETHRVGEDAGARPHRERVAGRRQVVVRRVH